MKRLILFFLLFTSCFLHAQVTNLVFEGGVNTTLKFSPYKFNTSIGITYNVAKHYAIGVKYHPNLYSGADYTSITHYFKFPLSSKVSLNLEPRLIFTTERVVKLNVSPKLSYRLAPNLFYYLKGTFEFNTDFKIITGLIYNVKLY